MSTRRGRVHPEVYREARRQGHKPAYAAWLGRDPVVTLDSDPNVMGYDGGTFVYAGETFTYLPEREGAGAMSDRKTTTETGEVAQIDHAGTSANGNPTYRVRLVDGRSWLTETDGQVGYAATNYRPHSLRRPVSPVVLTLRGSRIVKMARPDGTDA